MSVADYFSSMDYGPAPEDDSAARAWLDQHANGFGHFIGGALRRAISGRALRLARTRDRARAREDRRRAIERDVDAAVDAARTALPAWQALGGAGRARHLYALARMVQRHARLFAVLESLDNGKPIRESRDIDIPLVARHFLHHAGWAQLQDREFADWDAAGRGRADRAVEFPAADARVEDRAGARAGQLRGAQAGGIHAADRACCSPNSQRGGLAGRRAERCDRRRRDRAPRSSTIRASTRSRSRVRRKSAA